MCNRKDEGGRCYAHLTQSIQALDKREEQEIHQAALKAGVPVDEVALREKTAAAIADCEKDREDFKAELAEKKATMLELHKKAQTELRRSLVVYDQERRGALISNPFAKPEAESKPEDLPGFVGYEDATAYVEAQRFADAVTLEKRKAEEDFIRVRNEYEDRQEKEAARNNLELRSLKRKLFFAEAKEMLDNGNSGAEAYKLEKQYDRLLKEEIAKTGTPFHESEECKKAKERVNTVTAEFNHAQRHKDEFEQKLLKHWHGNSAISPEAKRTFSSDLRSSLGVKPGDYQKLKGGHYARRFRDAKEEYVRTANCEPNWKTRSDNAVKDVKNNLPLDKEGLEKYRSTVYPTTDVAKEIKAQRDSAQKELVLTRTYRNNLRTQIDHKYYNGENVTKEREVLAKLDAAANARKERRAVPSKAPRAKREELEEIPDDVHYLPLQG